MNEKLVLEGFDSNFSEIFERFLSRYKNNKANLNNYRNVFRKLLAHINKPDITSWSFEDYKNAKDSGINDSTQQVFKFLYAYDYLQEDVDSFTKEFGNKNTILKRIAKDIEKSKEVYPLALTLKELEQIISWVNSIAETDFEKMRIAFVFYLLFDVGLRAQKEVLEFDAINYNSKGLYEFSDGKIIEIPERFDLFLKDLKQQSLTGLSTANINIADLGDYVGIPNLLPKQILSARKQRFLQCPECGDEFLSSLDNWISINGYLVCKGCGEQLLDEQNIKKNEMINNIPNYTLEFLSPDDIDTDDIPLTQDDNGFSEGNQYLKKHLARERSQKLVRLAKARFLRLNGALFCEVCHFDFSKAYGSLGENFIEAHHMKPVSEMRENEKTQIEDLWMVCSNCHSMVHRIKPWAKQIEDLRKIISPNFINEY